MEALDERVRGAAKTEHSLMGDFPTLVGRRVLFISYNGMLESLGQTQVLPYLRQLSNVGVRFTLLSFERENAFTFEGQQQCKQLKEELARANIEWHRLRYHQRPSIPATAYDVVRGIHEARKLIKRNQIELVHARSQIAAAMALVLKRRLGVKMIFDVRGLMAEEYVDAQHWRENSLPFKLVKALEAKSLSAADAIVTLTEKIWPIMRTWPSLAQRNVIHSVVPCCTDLNVFKFDPESRTKVRTELEIENRLVLVYSGSVDNWNLTDKMAEYFSFLLQHRPDAYFLWLTNSRDERIRQLMRTYSVPDSSFTVRGVGPREVAAYLSAADVAIAFARPGLSKLASSPTKYAEYLACGLPIILSAGVGDSDELITKHEAGALVREFTAAEYATTLPIISAHLAQPEATRMRLRDLARQLFDLKTVGLQRYAKLYERVLAA